MLNKKSLFNFVYAIALVGAVISCVGILNEFLNIAQLYGVQIPNTITMEKEKFFEPFFFYLLAFIIAAVAIVILLLHLFGILKLNKKYVNMILLVACMVLLVMSFVFLYFLRYFYEYSREYQGVHVSVAEYRLDYFNYLIYYTFRSGVMSFVANMGILLTCHLLDAKCKNNAEGE